MTEIEIKAHVLNKTAIVARLNEIAEYKGCIVRDDEYYRQGESNTYPLRIRKETKNTESTYFLTYKHKTLHKNDDGTEIEVNDEKECVLSDPSPLISFFYDNNFELYLTKRKEILLWKLSDMSLELCTIQPIGDFLEMEIVVPECSSDELNEYHKKLESTLEFIGIPKEQIEPRSYAQLLKSRNTMNG